MNVTKVLTKDYENNPSPAAQKQTQFKPNLVEQDRQGVSIVYCLLIIWGFFVPLLGVAVGFDE